MAHRIDPEPVEHDDEQLGEAIEVYLALAEAGSAPEAEEFASRYPDLEQDLLAALEGLALVQGLMGDPGGSGHGHAHGGRLESGRKIAGYRIVGELGRGGMGVVYEAVHVALDRPVALKVLATPSAPDSSGRRRFINEAKTAAGLHHTHIVPVFDVGQVGGLSYYAMQRIEGSGLDRVIKHLRRGRTTAAGNSQSNITPIWSRLGSFRPSLGGSLPKGSESVTASWSAGAADHPLQQSGLLDPTHGNSFGLGGTGGRLERPLERDDTPPPFEPPRGHAYYRWVAEVGLAAADALDHAHTRGVIHRDIKPSNLLVDGRGFIWVADFGLARRLADPDQTHHESLIGTPRYMSPEQARSGPVDGRSDLYSLGATLYELLALRPPFDGRSTAELVEQIGKLEPPSPRQSDPKIPRDLETIVLKLLSKRPSERYATAAELAEDLTRFLHFEPVQARRISQVGRFIRFARRHPSGTAITTAAVVTVLTVSTVAYLRILEERNAAIQARAETLQALQNQFYSEAHTLLGSNAPNRRVRGMKLLQDAASRKPPGPALLGKLLDEAVEFLVIRDVEARPGFPTGRARGLAFVADGSRVAALTLHDDGGDSFSLFNAQTLEKIAESPLREREGGRDASQSRGYGTGGPGPGGPGVRRGGLGEIVPTIASAGKFMAVIAPDRRGVRFYDATTGKPGKELLLANSSGRNIVTLFATPNGARLVTVEVVLPTPRDRRPPGSGPADEPTTKSATPRPATHWLVNLWDSKSHALEKPLKTLFQYDQESRFELPPLVAISPDGKTLATARHLKPSVALWSTETGEALGPQLDTQAELTALAIGPENQFATAGSGEIRLWDLNTRTPVQSVTPNQSAVRLLRFSPHGSFLAVVGILGRDIELWDTDAHTRVAVLSSAEPIHEVAFSPDGRTLAATGAGSFLLDERTFAATNPGIKTQVWEVVDPDVRVRRGFDSVTGSLAFRADGLLALGSWSGTTRFWNAGRRFNALLPTESTTPVTTSTNSSEDASRRDLRTSLAFDDRGRLITIERGALRVIENPPDGLTSTDVDFPSVQGQGSSFAILAPSTNGKRMAILRNGQVFLWNSSEPDRVELVTPPPSPIPSRGDRRGGDRGGNGTPSGPPPSGGTGGSRGFGFGPKLAVSSDGSRIYLIDPFGSLAIWEVSGNKARALTWAHVPTRNNVLPKANALALSPGDDVLAIGNGDGSITLLETATGNVRETLVKGDTEGRVEALAFSPDGRKLAVATQLHIDIWSLNNPKAAPLRLPGHRSLVTALAFDPKGQYLASAGLDRTADVWNLTRLREEFEKLGLAW